MKSRSNSGEPENPANSRRYTVPDKPETNDLRKEVLVLGHCLLNPLARVKGVRPASPVDPKGANVIQLPCPESMYLGMRRREITKDQLDHPSYRRFCREIFTPLCRYARRPCSKRNQHKDYRCPEKPLLRSQNNKRRRRARKIKGVPPQPCPGTGCLWKRL